MSRVSVVVLSWNTAELTLECLRAVQGAFARGEAEGELVVVDNGSTDGSSQKIEAAFPDAVLVKNDENHGYARGVNQGVAASSGDWVLLLGSDAFLREGALKGMLDFMVGAEGYGACAPRLVGQDGKTQEACAAFPRPRTAIWFGTPLQHWFPNSSELRRYFLRDFAHDADSDVEQPPATCMLIGREVLERLGGMDESLWLFFNDVDLCKRLQAEGLLIRFLVDPLVQHVGGASTARYTTFVERWHTDRLRYMRKHHGLLGVLCARLGTTWAFAAWGLRRVFFRVRDPFWERVGSYIRFLRA